jgi:hypothetical protein
MRKYRVDACKFPRSIRLAVTLVGLLVFGILIFSPYSIRVPIAYANPDVASFYPSGYNLYGSTQYLSGSLSDLQSDNAVYMTFRSYASATTTNNIVTNGNVTTTTGWTYADISDPSAVVSGGYSSTVYRSASYSLYIELVDNDATIAYTGSGKQYQAMTTVSTLPTSATLYFFYRMDCGGTSALAEVANATVTITKPDSSTVTVFTTSVTFTALTTGSWIYKTIDVSSVFTATGTYTLDLRGYFSTTAAKKPTLTVYYDDVWLNIVTPSEYTSEVEFTGTSNTQSWTQLVWTVDSSFTTTSVTTTLQLYNYNSGKYPDSGDGYMTDTIGTTDVTKIQTITTNPTYFRDALGNWKMKIKGVKSTSTQFDWNGDLVKIEVTWTVGYALNLRVRDWDLTDNIQGAIVYKDSDTKTSDSNGWANWTNAYGTVQIKVKYFGFWVNGTFSVTMDSDKTIDVKCKLYDVTVKVQEAQHNAYLVSANVTVFNASSTKANKIKSGITGSTGQVSFTNLPNNTLVFTQYGGSSYSIVIGNATQAVSSENQSVTLTSNQNYVSTSNPYSIIALLGLIIPLKKRSQLDVSKENKVKKCKRRWKKQ